MASRIKRSWIVEDTWVCSSCQANNKGRNMKCATCGNPKEQHEKYDSTNAAFKPQVTDKKMLEQASAGTNWECEYCKNSVRNLYGECSVCGGTKTIEATETNNSVLQSKQQIKFDKTTKKFVSIGIGCFGLLVFLLWLMFADKHREVMVTETFWQHTSTLQQRKTLHAVSWDQDMDPTHFNEQCVTKQHGTHSCDPYSCNPHQQSYDCNCHDVPSGESCRTSCRSRGNGYSSCSEVCTTRYREVCSTCTRTVYDTCWHQCPTMDRWCSYDFYRWDNIQASTVSGRNNLDLHDSNVFVAHETNSGPQRIVVDRSYRIVFTDFSDKNSNNQYQTYRFTPSSSSEFRRFVYGERWEIDISFTDEVRPQHRIGR